MYTFLHLPFTSHFLGTDFLLYPCPNLVHSLSVWTKMEDVLHLSFLRCLVTNLRYTVGKASWKKPDTNRLPLLVVLVRARHEEFTLVRSKPVFSYNRKSCFSSSYFAASFQWTAWNILCLINILWVCGPVIYCDVKLCPPSPPRVDRWLCDVLLLMNGNRGTFAWGPYNTLTSFLSLPVSVVLKMLVVPRTCFSLLHSRFGCSKSLFLPCSLSVFLTSCFIRSDVDELYFVLCKKKQCVWNI